MAGLSSQERLQPSLLDRLRDDGPEGRLRGIDAAQLRESVKRDLGWLLNCIRPQPPRERRVEDSVLCYGIPDLAGMSAESHDVDALRRAIHAAILRFEPRLLPGTLTVEFDPAAGGGRGLSFRIESVLWAQPFPLRIRLDAEADPETFRFAMPDEPY